MDLITHVPSLQAMLLEAIAIQSDEESSLAKYFTIKDSDVTFNVSKVPVIYANDGETLCLVRGISRAVLEQSTSINVLGECLGNDYIFDSDDAKATYERILGEREVVYVDDDGASKTYIKPYEIGVFC